MRPRVRTRQLPQRALRHDAERALVRRGIGATLGRLVARRRGLAAVPAALGASACRVAGPAPSAAAPPPCLRARAGADPGPGSADRCAVPECAGRTPAARSVRSAAGAPPRCAPGAPRTGQAVPHRRPGPAAAGARHRAGRARRRSAPRRPATVASAWTAGEPQQTRAGRDQITDAVACLMPLVFASAGGRRPW